MNRQSRLIMAVVIIVVGIGFCYAQEEKTKSFILSDLTAEKIIVTEAIPKYETGKEIRDYGTCFNKKTIDVKNGKADIVLGESPVFIEIGESYPKASIASYKDSPFGFHPADVSINNYPDNGFIDASNIGVKWARQGLYVFWFLVQPDINLPNYDFSKYDEQWRNIPVNINILANIAVIPTALLRPQGEHKQREEIDSSKRKKARSHVKQGSFLPKGEHKQGKTVDSSEREKAREYVKQGSFLPVDEKKYVAFVRAAVERYDGDGINDMSGLKNPIKYWQVGNEPPGGLTDYAEFLKLNYNAIKESCPECKVLIGGVPGMPPASNYLSKFDKSFLPILNELAKLNSRSFDIFDFHWYGNATGDYKGIKEANDYIKQKIDALGFSPEEYWVTEMGSYSGEPSGGMVKDAFLYQTEAQQAGDYLKRFVLSLSLRIKKIFLAFGLVEGFKHNDGYFDHTGLIYDGDGSNDLGRGIKKLSYYTYKLMTEKLEGSNWDNIETIIDGIDNIYVYKFNRKDLGRPVYVAWGDYFTEEKREEKRELKKEETGPRKKSQPSRMGRCGDGICGPVERRKGTCPQDCEGLLQDLKQQSADSKFIYGMWLGRGLFSDEELERGFRVAHNLGARYFKVEFKWGYIEPQNNNWQWNNEKTIDVEKIIELAKKYGLSIIPYFDVWMPWADVRRPDPKKGECEGMGSKGQYPAPEPEEYADYVFQVVKKLKENGVDVGYIELDNEASNGLDGYVSYSCFINATAKQLKEAENAAYDKVKTAYPSVMISSTTFVFPGLSCGSMVNCEKDKERRNSFMKVYFAENPKPKFDFLGIHETLGGSGNPFTTTEKPENATYEYNFGSYYDAYDMWREILDKYGYFDKPIINTESAAVLKGKQDAELLQRVVFARINSDRNKVKGWILSQLSGSKKFTESGPTGSEAFSTGITKLGDGYELREGYYGYYVLMKTLANYPKYEGKIAGELNCQIPWVEKFSNNDGKYLYVAFIPYGSGESKSKKIELTLDSVEARITKSNTNSFVIKTSQDLEINEHPVLIEVIKGEDISIVSDNKCTQRSFQGQQQPAVQQPPRRQPPAQNQTHPYCGDGICGPAERRKGTCPQDCGS